MAQLAVCAGDGGRDAPTAAELASDVQTAGPRPGGRLLAAQAFQTGPRQLLPQAPRYLQKHWFGTCQGLVLVQVSFPVLTCIFLEKANYSVELEE